jgi:hypothetical protein
MIELQPRFTLTDLARISHRNCHEKSGNGLDTRYETYSSKVKYSDWTVVSGKGLLRGGQGKNSCEAFAEGVAPKDYTGV